jgi:hypothetical protein
MGIDSWVVGTGYRSLFAVGLALGLLACSSSPGSSGGPAAGAADATAGDASNSELPDGAPGVDGGDATPGDAMPTAVDSACGEFFEAAMVHGGLHLLLPNYDICPTLDPLPDAVRAVLKPEFVALCAQELSLPGVAISTAWLAGCSAALAGISCGDPMPGACVVPAGSGTQGPCLSSLQCRAFCDDVCFDYVPVGGPCVAFDVVGFPGPIVPCVAGSLCVPDPEGGILDVYGTCAIGQAPASPGAACDDDAGLHCQEGYRCTQGVCTGTGVQGSECAGADDCAPPLRCVNFDPASPYGACDPLGAINDAGMIPCSTDRACPPGLQCGGGSICAVGLEAGAACQVTADCAQGAFCGPDGKCAEDTPVGGPCDGGSDSLNCPFTRPCVETSDAGVCYNDCHAGTCLEKNPASAWFGESCIRGTVEYGCVAEGPCPDNGVCAGLVASGAPCDDSVSCGPFATCTNGACTLNRF